MTNHRRKRRDEDMPLFAAAVARRVPPAGAGRDMDSGDVTPIESWRAVEPADTRREARARIEPHTGRMLDAVLEFVREQGDYGATDEEIKIGLGLRGDTARARRCELRDLGLLHASGQTRQTDSGRAAIVWTSTATGAALRSPGDRRENPAPAIAADGRRSDTDAAVAGIRGRNGETENPGFNDSGSEDSDASEANGDMEPCAWCAGRVFWVSIYGRRVCTRCHPPAAPELVQERSEG